MGHLSQPDGFRLKKTPTLSGTSKHMCQTGFLINTACKAIYAHIWANYNNSLTWIKAIWGWFPLLIMIPVRSQWSRYNLPRYMGCLYHPISPEFLWKRWYQRILFCGGALDGTSMGPMTCAPFGIYDVRIQNGVTPEENQHETLKMAPYTEKIWENHISQVQNLMLHGFLIPVIPSYHVAGIGPQNMSCGIVFWDTVLKKWPELSLEGVSCSHVDGDLSHFRRLRGSNFVETILFWHIWDLMGFNGDLMGYNGISCGFKTRFWKEKKPQLLQRKSYAFPATIRPQLLHTLAHWRLREDVPLEPFAHPTGTATGRSGVSPSKGPWRLSGLRKDQQRNRTVISYSVSLIISIIIG